MEPTECSETSAFNIQTPRKYPEENIPYGVKLFVGCVELPDQGSHRYSSTFTIQGDSISIYELRPGHAAVSVETINMEIK
jgi:hypothetical protein